jgi:hypothetical protein
MVASKLISKLLGYMVPELSHAMWLYDTYSDLLVQLLFLQRSKCDACWSCSFPIFSGSSWRVASRVSLADTYGLQDAVGHDRITGKPRRSHLEGGAHRSTFKPCTMWVKTARTHTVLTVTSLLLVLFSSKRLRKRTTHSWKWLVAGLDDRGSARGRIRGSCLCHHCVQTGCGISGTLSSGMKRPERKTDHSSPSAAEVKSVCSFTYTDTHAHLHGVQLYFKGIILTLISYGYFKRKIKCTKWTCNRKVTLSFHMFFFQIRLSNSMDQSPPWEANNHPLKKLPVIYGTQRVRHWSLSWARWIYSTSSHLFP